MNKQDFDKLQAGLLERGYKVYDQHWNHEDYVIGKGFLKDENEWEEDRNPYQILLSVYDYSDKDYPSLTPEMRNRVGIEVTIGVSRTIDERIDLQFAWHDDTAIEEVEQFAERFYGFVCNAYPTPREEKSINLKTNTYGKETRVDR